MYISIHIMYVCAYVNISYSVTAHFISISCFLSELKFSFIFWQHLWPLYPQTFTTPFRTKNNAQTTVSRVARYLLDIDSPPPIFLLPSFHKNIVKEDLPISQDPGESGDGEGNTCLQRGVCGEPHSPYLNASPTIAPGSRSMNAPVYSLEN